jgi:hypothetical protein
MATINDGYIYTNQEVKDTAILEMCIQPRRRHDNDRRCTFQFKWPEDKLYIIYFLSALSQKEIKKKKT